jgi:hypothetical protein
VQRHAVKRRGAVVVAVGAIVLGAAAPAFAEGHFQSFMTNWDNGHTSRSWEDLNLDGSDTHATFAAGCTLEFRATIRKENFGPDTNMGDEWIDCGDYTDAVRVGDVSADDYHFDISDMSGGSCGKFSCTGPTTDVSRVDVYW